MSMEQSQELQTSLEAAILAITQLRFQFYSGVLLKKKAPPTEACFISTTVHFTSQDPTMLTFK